MSQLIEILKKHGENPVSTVDLLRAFSDGYRVFRFHDMDGEDDEPVEVHSAVDIMDGGAAYDQHLMVAPAHLPEDLLIRKEKRFYVTMLTGKFLADGTPEGFLLAGPFLLHESALALVDKARDYALKHDPKCWFYSFGTSGLTVRHGAHTLGPLNAGLGVEPEGV